MVLGLRLKRDLNQHLARAIHLEQARLRPGFAQQDHAIFERLDGIDLGLAALELEDHFPFAGDLDCRSARIVLVFGSCEQDVAIRQHPAVAGRMRILPSDLAVAVNDHRFLAAGEKRMLDLWFGFIGHAIWDDEQDCKEKTGTSPVKQG